MSQFSEDAELAKVFAEVLESPKISSSVIMQDLLRYLFEHRNEATRPEIIWKRVLKEKAEYVPDGPCASRVRERCATLRKILADYFPGNRPGWYFSLPGSVRAKGVQLLCIKRDDTQSVRHAFWAAHLDRDKEVSLVYVEQLFFERPDDGCVFRYYDCNAEHTKYALSEMSSLHPGVELAEGLLATYPYVAKGEVEAKNVITQWFDEYALLKVESVVTRELNHDGPTWEKSLILVGSASSNRFIKEALQYYPDLPVGLESRTRVRVNELADEEQERIRKMFAQYNCTAKTSGIERILEFNHQIGIVPAIITRIPNNRAKNAFITVLNSDFGKAVRGLADLITDEDRFMKGLGALNVRLPFPVCFQLLCGIYMRGEERPLLYPLVWRIYQANGI